MVLIGTYEDAELAGIDRHGLTKGNSFRMRVQRLDPVTGTNLDEDGRTAYGHLEMQAATDVIVDGSCVNVTGFVESADRDYHPSSSEYNERAHRPSWVLEQWIQSDG